MKKATNHSNKFPVFPVLICSLAVLGATHAGLKLDIDMHTDLLFPKAVAAVLPDSDIPIAGNQIPQDTKKPVALAVKPVVDVIKIERNPFVAPTDSITLPSSGSKDPITQGVSRPIANNVAPVLKGIVGNGTTSLAIIESNGTSNYYRIGQRVGNYTVSYIGGNIVDLFGAENSIRLFMGGK